MIARLAVSGAVLLAASVLGFVARRRRASGSWTPAAQRVPDRLRPDGGDGWTVLGFTSALCVACQRTPEVVAEALGTDAGAPRADGRAGDVGFEPVDVEEHPELVEHLDVTATPTVVVLDPSGRSRFAHRGNPAPDALAEHLPPQPRSGERGDRQVRDAVAVLLPGVDRRW